MNYFSSPQPKRLKPEDWCVLVATLCAPAMADQGMAALLDMLPLLQRRFDAWVFECDESAEAVALYQPDGERRRLAIPDYGEVVAALREWVREQRPMLPAPPTPVLRLAAPETREEEVTEEQRAERAEEFSRILRERLPWYRPREPVGRGRSAQIAALEPLSPPDCPDPCAGMTPEKRREWRIARGLYVPPKGV